MIITDYLSSGLVNEVHEYAYSPIERITSFDNHRPPISFNKKELRILLGSRNTFDHAMMIDKARMLLSCDLRNFTNDACYRRANEYLNFVSSSPCTKDKILSEIQFVFPLLELSSIESDEEKVCCVLQPTFQNAIHSMWNKDLSVTLFLLAYYKLLCLQDEKECCSESLSNILHSVINQFSKSLNILDDLNNNPKCKLIVNDIAETLYTLNNSFKAIKEVFGLIVNNVSLDIKQFEDYQVVRITQSIMTNDPYCRKDVYQMMSLLCAYNNQVNDNCSKCEYTSFLMSPLPSSPENDIYIINAGVKSYKIELSEEEICKLWEGDENLTRDIADFFSCIEQEYLKYNENELRNELHNEAGTIDEDWTMKTDLIWSALFLSQIRRIQQNIKLEENKRTPQTSFHYIWYQQTNVANPQFLTYSNKVIARFFNIIKQTSCINQEGFFAMKYKLNTLLENSGAEKISSVVKNNIKNDKQDMQKENIIINKMIDFLKPILNCEFIDENTITISRFEKLIRDILNIDEIKERLAFQKPGTFHYDGEQFNLKLLFNIIGVLVTKRVHDSPTYQYYFFTSRSCSKINTKLMNVHFGPKNKGGNNCKYIQYGSGGEGTEKQKYLELSAEMRKSVIDKVKIYAKEKWDSTKQ